MSTRGSVGYVHNGEFKGAYNHSDSYPDGLGVDVVDEVRKIQDWEKFKQNYEKLKWVPRDYVPTPAEIEENKEHANLSVSEQKYEDIYCLLREVQGANQIGLINEGKLTLAIDVSGFIKESLFCEYAYVLDLDNMMLEVYNGYQHKAQEGNRFGTEADSGFSCNNLAISKSVIHLLDNYSMRGRLVKDIEVLYRGGARITEPVRDFSFHPMSLFSSS